MITPIQDKEWVHPLSLILLREGNMSNDNNDKTIEVSQSDLLNAFFHLKLHEQHFATQESVDNLKERFLDFSARTDSNFEKVDESFKRVDAEFKEVRAEIKEVRTEIKDLSNKTDENFKELSNRMDTQFRWVLGLMVSGIIALVAQHFI
ncbi:hypothetical protein GNP73_08250 [Aliivibrio fischeri]|uniref:hypothetical protein n=1 Tax=Aliivibrio fischeri TaxID=668 RepID=UPI0012DAAD66|nr:hypothetical protein [Aliivibrio fischeri]MUJ27964.1 hypothetical protein [Aliivibrio fischeri]